MSVIKILKYNTYNSSIFLTKTGTKVHLGIAGYDKRENKKFDATESICMELK